MRVDSLRLQNFKCFKDSEFAFPEDFTLIVGVNGAGKTTILEALAFGIDTNELKPQLSNGDGQDLPFECIRMVQRRVGNAVHYEKPEMAHAQLNLSHRQEAFTVNKLSSGGNSPTSVSLSIWNKVINWETNVANQLPVLSYHGANRLPETKSATASLPRARSQTSRLEGYRGAASGKFAIPDILAWLRDEQYASLQEGKEGVLFKAVTEAMVSCLPGAKRIEYVIREYDVLVEFENGDVQPFRNLSDGQRIMLWLAADIAYRAAWLNPHLEDKVLSETDGIVLIDEIDLHLHPKWQRCVVDDLRRTFPKVQFIATSHSPFIIQSLRPGELLSLDGEPVVEYSNRGIEEIARFVQGVDVPHTSQRYADQKEAASKYFTLLRSGAQESSLEVVQAKDDLDQLTAHFGDNPAAAAFLELQKLAQPGANGS